MNLVKVAKIEKGQVVIYYEDYDSLELRDQVIINQELRKFVVLLGLVLMVW